MADNTQQQSWGVLKPGGMLVSLVQFPTPEAAAENQVQSAFVSAEGCNGEFLSRIGAMIDSGQLHPVISTVLPLSEIHQAHEQSEGRHVRGKTVLQVAPL